MNQAVEFARSHRGQYIVGQALYVAIQAMKKVPAPHTEHSNIADMEYLMKEMYPMYAAVNGPEVEEAMKVLKAQQKEV